jgi:hypothetical protein
MKFDMWAAMSALPMIFAVLGLGVFANAPYSFAKGWVKSQAVWEWVLLLAVLLNVGLFIKQVPTIVFVDSTLVSLHKEAR